MSELNIGIENSEIVLTLGSESKVLSDQSTAKFLGAFIAAVGILNKTQYTIVEETTISVEPLMMCVFDGKNIGLRLHAQAPYTFFDVESISSIVSGLLYAQSAITGKMYIVTEDLPAPTFPIEGTGSFFDYFNEYIKMYGNLNYTMFLELRKAFFTGANVSLLRTLSCNTKEDFNELQAELDTFMQTLLNDDK